MSAREEEPGILAKVLQAIRAWVPVLRRAVMASGQIDPTGVEDAQPAWADELDRVIMPALETVVDHAWRWQSGEPFISTNSFAQAQLAMTRNLLVRMPDDVYNAIFAEISTGQANGESNDVIAERIDRTLLTSGSEWWENRAKVIARTETNRAWNAGVLAAAQYYQPPAGPWVGEGLGRGPGRPRTPSPPRGRGADQVFDRHVPGGWGGSSVPWRPGGLDPTT